MNSNLDQDTALTPTASQQPLDGGQLSSVTIGLDYGPPSGFIENKMSEDEASQPSFELDMQGNLLNEGDEGGTGVHPPQDDQIQTAAGTPSPGEFVPEFTMKDLFGAFFEIDKPDGLAPNPLLVDTRGILMSVFGPDVNENDIIFENTEGVLRETMQQNKDLGIFDGLVELFGEHGAQVLRQEKPQRFHLLYASIPEAPFLADSDQTWLVEMPKMALNRQILHADPQPFFPLHCQYLESNPRMLYTPSNLIRWAYHKGQKLYMSNARLVRWSDHSLTLHVGSEVHSLLPAKGNAPVSLLGNVSSVSKAGLDLPALATTLHPDQHLVVESSEASSIERAVLEANTQRNGIAQRRLLPYTMATLPEIDWSKPKSRNPLEEFVMMQYEQRQKELDRRLKERRPMTLREQLDLEQEMLNQLQSTNVVALLEQKQEASRMAAIHAAAKRSHTRSGNHKRLERDLGLMSEDLNGNHQDYGVQEVEESNSSNDRSEEHEEADDYETMLNAMRQKRERENNEAADERRRHAARHEQEAFERFAPLLAALENLAQRLPMGTDAYGSVDGTVEFIRSGVFAPNIVEKEVPVMLQEVADELPDVDTTAVRKAFLTIFHNTGV